MQIFTKKLAYPYNYFHEIEDYYFSINEIKSEKKTNGKPNDEELERTNTKTEKKS